MRTKRDLHDSSSSEQLRTDFLSIPERNLSARGKLKESPLVTSGRCRQHLVDRKQVFRDLEIAAGGKGCGVIPDAGNQDEPDPNPEDYPRNGG
jgi:hypothetical protein